ncbi:MAG: aspartate carbamoyltransferase regulatory subunit [Peptostreptococcaceae bacterium]
MLTINSIKDGIVIDHIKAGEGIKIFNFLNLDKADFTVALIMNANSNKCEKKDIIKIESQMDIDFEILGVIDPNITIDVIENEEIKEKVKLKLPEMVKDVIKCKNPRCVTSIEPNISHIHHLVDADAKEYRCHYCDDLQKVTSLY